MSFNLCSPEHWQQVKLSSLGEVNRGRSRHRPRDAAHLYGGPYPFIQTGDIKASNGRIVDYRQTYSEAGLQQSRLWPKGTMCITIAANIAETGILQFPACFPDSVIGFIPDSSKCDVFYVEYMFRLMRKRIQLQATGSVQDNINLQTLERIEFPIPALHEQKAIAGVLCRLDDKIQLNHQINQTLEQMAQAIFKSWFVDFEPTRAKIIAKAQGADPATQELAAQVIICGAITLEQLAKLEQNLEITLQQAIDEKLSQGNQTPINAEQLKATAALFPNELVESELGEIPEGWKNNKIADLGKVVTGKTPPKKVVDAYADSGVPFITPSDVDDDLFVIRTNRYLTAEGTSAIKNTRVEAGAICVTCIGSQMGKTIISPNTAFTNQQINSIIVNRACFRNYLFLNLRNRRQEIYGIGSGGSTMPIINKSNFEKLEVLLPSIEVLKKFDSIVDVSMYKVLQGSRENKGLEKLRDTLLPKLLSGEIDVSALADNTEANA